MTTRPPTKVACSICGQPQNGTATTGKREGYRIPKHQRPDGSPCVGALITGHWPDETSTTKETT